MEKLCKCGHSFEKHCKIVGCWCGQECYVTGCGCKALQAAKPEPPTLKITLADGKVLTFTDVSSELYRIYHFPNEEQYVIEKPLWLYVGEHGHRVIDASGISHYVPFGWIGLYWLAKPDQPKFVR